MKITNKDKALVDYGESTMEVAMTDGSRLEFQETEPGVVEIRAITPDFSPTKTIGVKPRSHNSVSMVIADQ